MRRTLTVGALCVLTGGLTGYWLRATSQGRATADSRGTTDGATEREGPRTLETKSVTARDSEISESASVLGSGSTADATAVNPKLAHEIQSYRRQLGALEQEKAGLVARVGEVARKLEEAESRAGHSWTLNEFNPTREEWKKLAEEGTVKYQLPCSTPSGRGSLPPERLQALGLAPDDGPLLDAAFQKSTNDTWTQIRSICAEVIDAPLPVVDRIGLNSCTHVIMDHSPDSQGAQRFVASVRAGLAPPGATNTSPAARMLMAITGASGALESEIASAMGPEEARRLVSGSGLCFVRGSHLGDGAFAPK